MDNAENRKVSDRFMQIPGSVDTQEKNACKRIQKKVEYPSELTNAKAIDLRRFFPWQ